MKTQLVGENRETAFDIQNQTVADQLQKYEVEHDDIRNIEEYLEHTGFEE